MNKEEGGERRVVNFGKEPALVSADVEDHTFFNGDRKSSLGI
jgi:hypothetical protein